MILCVCPNPSVDTVVEVDDFAPGKVHRARAEHRYPGGKGVHVALAARELGAEVALLGFWGGPTGQWIRQRCGELGVTCTGPEVAGWSRSCLTFRAPAAYNETELLGCGPQVNGADIEALERELASRVAGARVVTLSGSWPVGAPVSAYARLLDIVYAHKKISVLDCTGPMLAPALERRPAAVHLNRAEAAAALHTDDPLEAARRLRRHCELAIVTAGAEGAYFARQGMTLHASCTIDARHSAVGSGDCLLAGVATALARGLPPEETAALACACGAANCLRPELGKLHGRDVQQLLPQVRVRRLP